jgi:hypothetical protein
MSKECEHGYWEYRDCGFWDTDVWLDDYRQVWHSYTEDIDLHRYKCTHCGEIMYYSGAAKDFYEKNIRQEGIKGLY